MIQPNSFKVFVFGPTSHAEFIDKVMQLNAESSNIYTVTNYENMDKSYEIVANVSQCSLLILITDNKGELNTDARYAKSIAEYNEKPVIIL